MMKKLWNDDAGFIISVEWLLVFTIVLLGLIVGLVNVRDAIDSELSEAANAVLALNQTYSFSGLATLGTGNCASSVQGSATADTPGAVGLTCVAAPTGVNINVVP